MVMVLVSVGVVGFAAVPRSLGARCIVAWPGSLKIVGHGAACVQGGGDVTFVMTSETTLLVAGSSVTAPRMPASESMMRYAGARPWRTTSPHDTVVPMSE